MDAPRRQDPRALALFEALEQRPWAFHLFAALRRLECAFNEHARLGESTRPADDAIRLAQEPSLAFSPHPIAAFDRTGQGAPRLVTDFFGLFGPNGALPQHLSEYARDRARNSKDETFARFLDIFQHRMLSLFYRAIANTEPAVSYDRPESDRFAKYVGALFGQGLVATQRREVVDDRAKLHFAARYAVGPRNAEGLAAILEGYLAVEARIEELVGEWVDLQDAWLWRLGGERALGRSTTIGTRAYLGQSKFRIILGPLDGDRYQRLLPRGDLHRALLALVRGYVGDALAFELRLVLNEQAMPPFSLGGTGRLGRDSWLGSRPRTVDVPLALEDDALDNAPTGPASARRHHEITN